jgi:glutaredoxin
MSGKAWLLVLAALLGGLYLKYQQRISQFDPRNNTGDDGIVMLSAEWCGYCKALRLELDGMGVDYRELDIETSEEGEMAFHAVRARGVPVLVVGQDIIYGYNPERARSLIRSAGHALAER